MSSLYDIATRQNWYCHKQKHNSFKERIYLKLELLLFFKGVQTSNDQFLGLKIIWDQVSLHYWIMK
jgi:hypothetical protein